MKIKSVNAYRVLEELLADIKFIIYIYRERERIKERERDEAWG